MSLRVIFAGTPAFSVAALEALLAARHDVALVLTQPDRASGRGMQLKPSPVKAVAVAHGLTVFQPAALRNDVDAERRLAAVGADVMVVVAYGLILPTRILDLPRFGAVNIHASLLPRWRGAAPIHRAILAGDRETGVAIMQMDASLDTGPVLLSEATPIDSSDTTGTLHDRLSAIGARLMLRALDDLEHGRAQPTTQPAAGVTYAHKIDKREAQLDWRKDAIELERQVRAFDPAPGASAMLGRIPMKVWKAVVEPAGRPGEPGQVLGVDDGGVVVACGSRALRLLELQRAGGKRLPAREFLRGTPVVPGDRFDLSM